MFMATWRLSNYENKSFFEILTYKKDDKELQRIIQWRYASYTFESDTAPEIDLKNENGLYLDDHDYPYDFEFEESGDGYGYFEYPEGLSEEETEALDRAIDCEEYDEFERGEDDEITDGYGDDIELALSRIGWKYDDTEYSFQGMLQLELVED